MQRFLISLCERIKPGPFSATPCHPGNRLLGDLCQMLLLKPQPHWQDKELSSPLLGLYAFTVCVCVCVCVCVRVPACTPVLFDVRRYTVSPRCSTPHRGCVLRSPPPCHPHLHASFLHPPSPKGPSGSTHNFVIQDSPDPGKNFAKLLCSYNPS